MVSLAESELVDHVIGIDPDRDAVTAAVVAPGGYRPVAGEQFPATGDGYGQVLVWADGFSSADRRAWAIEGSGSYGQGLCQVLRAAGEWVIEFSHPQTASSRSGAKNDLFDAARAAREVFDTGLDQLADPRSPDGCSEAVSTIWAARALAVRQRTAQINHLKAAVVTAPVGLRDQLATLSRAQLLTTCRRFRPGTDVLDPTVATKLALKTLADMIVTLDGHIATLTATLKTQTQTVAPQLLAEPGIGPVTAAVLFAAWSHKGRFRDEAAFAMLAGAAPLEATSGQTQSRHRLNRGGDRRVNQALALIVLTRVRNCEQTKTYINNRMAQGHSKRHTRRCLQRYVARRVFRLLENTP